MDSTLHAMIVAALESASLDYTAIRSLHTPIWPNNQSEQPGAAITLTIQKNRRTSFQKGMNELTRDIATMSKNEYQVFAVTATSDTECIAIIMLTPSAVPPIAISLLRPGLERLGVLAPNVTIEAVPNVDVAPAGPTRRGTKPAATNDGQATKTRTKRKKTNMKITELEKAIPKLEAWLRTQEGIQSLRHEDETIQDYELAMPEGSDSHEIYLYTRGDTHNVVSKYIVEFDTDLNVLNIMDVSSDECRECAHEYAANYPQYPGS